MTRTEEIFEEGMILYFNPFIFPDGGTPKPKYFIIIKKCEDRLLLASLPTSKDSVPAYTDTVHGCIDMPDINFNCYCFKGGKPVADGIVPGEHFAFPLDTFIYGFRINMFDGSTFETQVNSGVTDMKVIGKLYANEFKSLLLCLKNSSSVKRKYKRIM